MGVTISEIRTSQDLQKAAEMADTNEKVGNFNHELDACEVTVFVQRAKKMGVDYNEIIQVTNSLGMTLEDKDAISKMEQLKYIEQLESNLEKTRGELEAAKAKGSQPDTNAQAVSSIVGFVGGGFAGAKILAGATVAGLPGIVCAGLVLGVAVLAGIGGFHLGKVFDDDYTKHDREVAKEYENTVVKQLEEQVKQQEAELATAKNSFFSE